MIHWCSHFLLKVDKPYDKIIKLNQLPNSRSNCCSWELHFETMYSYLRTIMHTKSPTQRFKNFLWFYNFWLEEGRVGIGGIRHLPRFWVPYEVWTTATALLKSFIDMVYNKCWPVISILVVEINLKIWSWKLWSFMFHIFFKS